jgi:hypothetical protein
VSTERRAFVTVDRGTATNAVALVAQVAGTWRLLGSTSAPTSVTADALVERLRRRLAEADPELAGQLDLAQPGSGTDLPRVGCSTTRPPEIAVLAATRRIAEPLAAIAATAGWRVRTLVLDGAEILPVVTALADSRVTTVVAAASDPPGADERSLIPDLAAVLAAAIDRRPDLVTVLAGGLATPGNRMEALLGDRGGSMILGPSPLGRDSAPLHALLDSLRDGAEDGRRALAAATGTLAEVLRRRVEVIEIGQAGATRAVASWRAGEASRARWASVPAAALLPPSFTEAHLDAVARWFTTPVDRLRVRDRLRELALSPWGDSPGEGAPLRLAAARAALSRLVAATPALDAGPGPDVLIAAGGAWAVAPAPALALALADVVRRPGVRAQGWDHARVLAPLGTIADEDERRAVMADLRDDLLVPLGSIVMPAGLRTGRAAGSLSVARAGGAVERELVPGEIEHVDLLPGERAVVELRFRDPVDLGLQARHVAVEVAGGLGGLLVDLRDVPLRLPDRPEPRRERLAAWQSAAWTGIGA